MPLPALAAQVFELDSAAVARILEAAANCAQDASPRAESSDALLRVAREYGLVHGESAQAVQSEGAGTAAEEEAGERQQAALQVVASRMCGDIALRVLVSLGGSGGERGGARGGRS